MARNTRKAKPMAPKAGFKELSWSKKDLDDFIHNN